MKKHILILFIALLSISFTSCKKTEDQNPDLTPTWITGKWKRTVSYLYWVEYGKSYRDTDYTAAELTFIGGKTGQVISSEKPNPKQINYYALDLAPGGSYIDFFAIQRQPITKINDKEFTISYDSFAGVNVNKTTHYTDTYVKDE